jgi:transcriptional regulator with XRE-family HTH domain
MAKALGWLKEEREKRGRDYRYYLYRLINEVTDKIENLMELQGLSRKQLAERLGVSKSTISRILDGNRNMTLETLTKVAFALGYKPEIELKPLSDEFEEMEINLQEVGYENNALKIA